MTREQAEKERKRLAREHPESTWMVTEAEAGSWSLVRIGLTPGDPATSETIETKPRPPQADDPRSAAQRNAGPYAGG